MHEMFLACHGGEFTIRVKDENGVVKTLSSECGSLKDALVSASAKVGGPVGIKLVVPPDAQERLERAMGTLPPSRRLLRSDF